MSSFIIFADDPNVKLKSFSGTFNGKKGSLRINLEIENPDQELGYHLRQLKAIEAEQLRLAKIKRDLKSKSPKPKEQQKITEQKRLMLPGPQDHDQG